MALRISDDDTQLNPGQIDADRTFGDIAKAEEKGTFDDITSPENMAKDGVSGDLAGQARDAEDTPPGGWANKTGDTSSQTPKQAGFLIRGKPRRGPLIGIIIALLIGGGGAGFFLAPILGPIAFIENITDDLNDQLGAMNVRDGYVFRNKIPSADRQKALTGCTKISIRCKFATVNEKQIARLKASGIEATSKSPSGLWGKRIKPDNYRFQGVDYSPSAWADQLKTNPEAQHAQRKANNMKFLGTRSPAFNRTLAKFGVSLRPPELKGSAVDRVNALLNKAGAASPTDLVFKPSDDVDENGKPKSYTLEGDTSNKSYTPAEVETMKGSIARVANARPPSRVTKASIGALSVLGYWDLACSIKNMLVGATVAAKIANQAELIAWFMPIATLVGKIKSGEATPEEAEAVGLFFNQTDNRQKLVDIEKSITAASGSGVISVNDELDQSLDNPNYGKSAMDASLLQMSINGGVAPASTTRSQFSLGLGNNALLSGVSSFAEILNIILNIGDASMCRWIQNPVTRIVGGIVGVAAAVGSGGTSLVIQGVVAAGMMAAMMVLDTIINNALQGSLVDNADFESGTVERGEAGWTAMSGLLSTSAQQNGLMPGTSEGIVEYAQIQNQTKQEYIALEASEANQLDIYNQYSFAGSFARSIMGYSSSSVSVGSFFNNIASIVNGGLLSFTKPYSAYAATIDESRFKQCDDSSYTALGIDADVQCNIRYIMPTQDLALDTDEVAIWMEDTGQVAKDTITGLPVGYKLPEPAQSQGLALDFITGVVDTALNTKPLPNEYAKFLEYCVYRTMPFGETGEETSAVNDEEPEWKTGANCMKTGAPYSYFRIYTLDKSIQEAIDDETVVAIDNNKQALAQEIIDSPNVSYFDGDNGTDASGKLISIKEQIQSIADGSSDGNTAPCQVNMAILQIVSDLVSSGHTLTISDINRNCVNSSLTNTISPHWTGNAIDMSVFDGADTTNLAATNAVLEIAAKYMPAGSMIGIVRDCNPGITGVFQGFQVFDDPGACGHLHIGMPLGSDPEYSG